MLGEVLFVVSVTSSWRVASPTLPAAPRPLTYHHHQNGDYLSLRTDFSNYTNIDRNNSVRNDIYDDSRKGFIDLSVVEEQRGSGARAEGRGGGSGGVTSAARRGRRRSRHQTYAHSRRERRRHHNRRKSRRDSENAKKSSPWGGSKRRRNKLHKNRHNRGNRTSGRPPKRTVKTGGGHRNRGNRWNSPNRRGGWSAGQQYRTLDPRRAKVRRHLVMQHNLLRSKVMPHAANMLAVGWYDTAAEQAQAWAEQCDPHTHHDHPSVRWTSRYGACGQNVLVSDTKKRWSQVIARWWSGRRHFRYGRNNNNNSSKVSSYTQMAWYNSHQLGCGFAQCSTTGGNTFFRYVCNYCPAGNDPGRLSRPYTEGETCSLCPGSCKSLCHRRRCNLCTNACAYSDLWINCATLDQEWHEWLCNTKTTHGVERFKNCRATCQCVKEIT